MRKLSRWLLLALCWFLVAWYAKEKAVYNLEIPVFQVGTCLRLYIRDHHGQFPNSRLDLENGYLRIDEVAGKFSYHVRGDLVETMTREVAKQSVEGNWMPCPFDKFQVRYGSSKSNIALRDGQLYDRTTGKRVLLLTGPHPLLLRRTYEALSLSLFNELRHPEDKVDPSGALKPSSTLGVAVYWPTDFVCGQIGGFCEIERSRAAGI